MGGHEGNFVLVCHVLWSPLVLCDNVATEHSYPLLRPLSGQQLLIMLLRPRRTVRRLSLQSQICSGYKKCTHPHRIFCIFLANRSPKHSGDSLHSLRETDGLYPLQALVQPVALRFKYHFDSERETNRLDKVDKFCCPYKCCSLSNSFPARVVFYAHRQRCA